MPIVIQYDADRGIVYGRMSGKVNVDEIRDAMGRALGSGEFPPDSPTLWDFSELDFTEIDLEFQEQLIKIREQFPERGGARVAFVAPESLGFGTTRMYGLLSDDLPQKMAVFRSHAEAEAWLIQV